ncbi:CubicO group peptidase, beta-lactamase class C family [Mucilaginibacter lappiensis]|uniref:CubicO group peptidase (Beta-lactamase class C family) n=1 Tax=Mucilaginibacter lappiensis TaxID=354630 RepID=A0ABR6PT84_9SPHI|nr:serine hydrolase domain-containing protein [Mucilaginibacter lappiensis]MBB6113000.1 CubicO group peptidase (beta-lactamase class C family) [Mucilaginibacter lappiensis]SIS10475.1 CubicO group peptidase, beta-lactamase class C family [Mucilaginibacter lappiensis]
MTIRNSVFGIIAIFLISIVGCKKSEQVIKTSGKDFHKIETYLQSIVDSGNVPGIAIAITNGQDVAYSKGFGVTNVQTREKLEPRHNFHIASISKTFTATAVMQLAEQGKIDINKPLVTYLPYFKLDDERYKAITIKQMLNHTSGMPDVENYEWEKAISDEGAAERYTKSLADKKMISNPGAEFHYSNMAFDVMGDLIAKVSGTSFEKYVKDNILTPLEMYEGSFYFPETKKNLRTTPHTGKPPVVSLIYPYNRMHAPSSTLNTNVLELSHWAIANMYEGKYKNKQIISPSTYAMMMTPTFTIYPNLKASIGLSWFILPYKGLMNYTHDGGDLGYRNVLTLIPEKKLGIILLSNTQEIDIQYVHDKIRDILLSDE